LLRAQDQTRALRKEWGTLSVERAGQEEERLGHPAMGFRVVQTSLSKMSPPV